VPEEDITGSHPNFKDAKVIIDSYFTLNDLLLGKIVGEKDSKKEKYYLEKELQILDYDTKFKANVAELVTSIDKATPENDFDNIIEKTRSMFREQLKQCSSYCLVWNDITWVHVVLEKCSSPHPSTVE
jgi:hypothetical protein